MPSPDALPELKRILGALIFGANRPLGLNELRRCLVEVADLAEDAAVYAQVKASDIRESIDELQREFDRMHMGFGIAEVAGGYRLQSDVACGRWLKHLLQTRPQRLSRPALETLAIVAYRQPIGKADIEGVRGVAVAHVLKALMEAQLVRIVGRSELPGRPFLYGTTHVFLEHFGLRDLKDLNKMAPMVLMRREGAQAVGASDSDAEGDAAGQAPQTAPTRLLPPELPLGNVDGEPEDMTPDDGEEDKTDDGV